MNELAKAVEYNIKPILWYLGMIIVCLLIGTAIGTFWFHDVLFPPMQVTDITQAEYHGVTIHPATVAAAAGVLAGIIARTQLIMNFHAVHGWGEPIQPPNSGSKGSTAPPQSVEQVVDNQKQWFQAPRHIRFASDGEYYADPWGVSVIISQLANGDYQVLTNEDGVSFTVKSAVAVKPKPALKWSAGYLYGTNGSHEIIIRRDLTGWLGVLTA